MLKLKVEGMSCNHCVMAVKKALLKVPGVERAEVSLEKGEAWVEGKAEVETLIRAVEEEGYKASPLA